MTEDISLKIIRTTIFSIVVPHKEPCSSYKIKMEYKDMEGEDIPFKDYGHRDLDDFLLNHPMLTGMVQEGKWVFTAKMSERSANIQALVKGQKSKKRKGAKKGNNPFARNSTRSSYHGRPSLGQGDVRRANGPQPFVRNQSTYRSFTSGTSSYRPPTAPINSNPSNSSNNPWGSQQSRSSFGASSNSSFVPPSARPSQQWTGNRKFIPTLPPTRSSTVMEPSRPNGPQEGMRRFNTILFKCKGAATLRVFCRLYAQEFHVPFDAQELKRHFDTVNLAEVMNKHGNDKILVSPTPDGSVMFTDSQVLETHTRAARELEEKKKNSVVIEPEKKHCSIPSLPRMFDEMTDMLVDSFPNGIPIDDITSQYEERAHVKVNPQAVFALTWKELIEKKFVSRVRIENGKAVLTPSYIKANNLQARGERKKQELVTLDGLGMVYLEDSSQDDDDEDEEESQSETASLASVDVKHNKTSWRAPPSEYGSMCSSVSSSVQALNASPRDTSDSAISEEVDELTDKMRSVKVEVDEDSPREITITQSSPKNGESTSRRNLMSTSNVFDVNRTLKKEETEKDEKPAKSRSFFSKFSFNFGASRNTPSTTPSVSSATMKEEPKEEGHPAVIMMPHPELKVKADGEYKSFSFTLDSKNVYAFRVTCKSSLYRIIGGTGFTHVGSPKLLQVMREFGPVGKTPITIDFVKRITGDKRMAADIIDNSKPEFTFEYAFNAL